MSSELKVDPLDPQNCISWICPCSLAVFAFFLAEIWLLFVLKGKFRWLSEELKARLLSERRLKEQAEWSHKRIRVSNTSEHVDRPFSSHATCKRPLFYESGVWGILLHRDVE